MFRDLSLTVDLWGLIESTVHIVNSLPLTWLHILSYAFHGMGLPSFDVDAGRAYGPPAVKKKWSFFSRHKKPKASQLNVWIRMDQLEVQAH